MTAETEFAAVTDEELSEHYPSFTLSQGAIGCNCGWEVERTRLDQAVQDYAEHRSAVAVALAIESLASYAEDWPDDEADSGGAVADWLRSRISPSTSPAGSPAPTMDTSERANGGTVVASRTGTGPAGEAQADRGASA